MILTNFSKAIDDYLIAKNVPLTEEGYGKLLYKRRSPELKDCWEVIGYSLPKRPIQAIYQRSRKLINLEKFSVKQNDWSSDELKQLKKLVSIYGTNWVSIGKELNRLDTSCRDRYRLLTESTAENRSKHHKVRAATFSPEEDELLTKLISQYKIGGMILWSKVAKQMPNKTLRQCFHYWNFIKKGNRIRPLPQNDLLLIEKYVNNILNLIHSHFVFF